MLHQRIPFCYPRLGEEFHLRLERERQQRENAEAEALRRAARHEERRKGIELAREAAETAVMVAEDARSAIAVRLKTLQLAFASHVARCVVCLEDPAIVFRPLFSCCSSRDSAQTTVLYMDTYPQPRSPPWCCAPEGVARNLFAHVLFCFPLHT